MKSRHDDLVQLVINFPNVENTHQLAADFGDPPDGKCRPHALGAWNFSASKRTTSFIPSHPSVDIAISLHRAAINRHVGPKLSPIGLHKILQFESARSIITAWPTRPISPRSWLHSVSVALKAVTGGGRYLTNDLTAAQRAGGAPVAGTFQAAPNAQATAIPPGYPGALPTPVPQANLGSFQLPQPSNTGSLDLSGIKPANSGTVSLAEAIAKAKGIAAQKGVAYDGRSGKSWR